MNLTKLGYFRTEEQLKNAVIIKPSQSRDGFLFHIEKLIKKIGENDANCSGLHRS